MLTPINAQVTSQGSTSANAGGGDGDNGFGALLNDTKARRQSDAHSADSASDARSSPVSRQQARSDDAGVDKRSPAPQTAGGDSLVDGRRPSQTGSARQTLSSALDQLQGNRLGSRGPRDEAAVQQGHDHGHSTLAGRKGMNEPRQAGLAALADGRRPLEPLPGDRSVSRTMAMDKQASDTRADALNVKGKRLGESDQTGSAASLYGLVDTGALVQTSLAQNAPAGREGSLPARRGMLEQGLRGRDGTALDGSTQDLQKGRAQEGARGERLFGELLSQREGPLFRPGSTGADAASGTQAVASAASDSPLSTLSALTGQSGAGSMASGTAQAVTTATLPAMDSDQWSSAFERQVINLSMRGGGEARLNMNPLELGPLSISLKMGEQSAQLHIASHHAQVRAAIEAALPQLREAFSASGIELGQTSVSDQGNFQQGGFQQQQERAPGAFVSRDASGAITGIDADTEVISISPLNGRSLNGGIDLFA